MPEAIPQSMPEAQQNSAVPNVEAHSNNPQPLVIVVGRQYGAGGRALGRLLAQTFNLPYYDKELLAEAAKSLGFDESIFSRHDEKRPSVFQTWLNGAFGVTSQYIATTGTLTPENIYTAQSRIIRRIAQQHNGCVIVGRSADYVLRHHPNMVSIFLHAPIDVRAEAIVARGEAPNMQRAIELARRIDRERQDYYNYYTEGGWGTAANYHLTFNSALVPTGHMARIVADFINSRK